MNEKIPYERLEMRCAHRGNIIAENGKVIGRQQDEIEALRGRIAELERLSRWLIAECRNDFENKWLSVDTQYAADDLELALDDKLEGE